MTYKAIVTDLDGTAVPLSSRGDDIPIKTIAIVQHALNNGKVIACATGRGWMYAKSVVRALGLRDPCIIEGGTRIINPISEETIWQKGMSDEAAESAKKVFMEFAPTGLFVTSNRDDVDDEEGAELGDAQKQHFTTVKDSSENLKNIRYLYLLGISSNEAKDVVNAINQSSEAVAHVTISWQGKDKHDVHVTDRLATKEHAIHEWRKLMGLKKDEVIGCGDSGNDLPIFEAVGLRVAAESGTDEVLALADYIAPSPEDNGLGHVIEKFLL